jgi:hypothetical protein
MSVERVKGWPILMSCIRLALGLSRWALGTRAEGWQGGAHEAYGKCRLNFLSSMQEAGAIVQPEPDITTMHHASFAQHWKETATGFLKLGSTAYGGPAIMGIMQSEFQEKRQWVTRAQSANAHRDRFRWWRCTWATKSREWLAPWWGP